MNKNTTYKRIFLLRIILAIIALIFILIGLFVYKNKQKTDFDNLPEDGFEILGDKEDLVYLSVQPGDAVSGILNLSGAIKGGYFFEGNILINLLDENQNILKKGYGTATTDWMTLEPVSFTASIDSSDINGDGYILILEDDPSDGEGGPVKKILVPVVFQNEVSSSTQKSEEQKTLSLKLYFPNTVYNPEMLDCSLVYEVNRVVPYTQSVASVALAELIKGPTASEKNNGYLGVIPEGTKVNNIKIENGVLFVDFNKEVESGGGSCSFASRVSSLNKTLKQFSTVKEIRYSVEGNSNQDEIFQP